VTATLTATGDDVAVGLPVSDSQTMKRALRDLRHGFEQRELWLSLGWQDIKQRYRRSTLGPFWITISTGVQAAFMGAFYSVLWSEPIHQFLPRVVVGFLIWNIISASILEGAEVFTANEGLIKQLPSALSVHVYRLVWRQLLFFAHNLAIYVIVLFTFGTFRHLSWTWFLTLPAMALMVLNSLWVTVVFGILSTRFRDIAPMLGSITMVLFLLSPVVWDPTQLHRAGSHRPAAQLVELSPTYHYLEMMREPMIGEHIYWYHWYIVIAITVLGWAVALFALRQFRSRVPYWV
jgi:ABC-2 type transport system permease protein